MYRHRLIECLIHRRLDGMDEINAARHVRRMRQRGKANPRTLGKADGNSIATESRGGFGDERMSRGFGAWRFERGHGQIQPQQQTFAQFGIVPGRLALPPAFQPALAPAQPMRRRTRHRTGKGNRHHGTDSAVTQDRMGHQASPALGRERQPHFQRLLAQLRQILADGAARPCRRREKVAGIPVGQHQCSLLDLATQSRYETGEPSGVETGVVHATEFKPRIG